MKMLKFFMWSAGFLLTALAFTACLNDDGYSLDYLQVDIATARPLDDRSFYLTMDDSTTLWPAAPIGLHFQPDKNQRVLINYTLLGDHFQGYDYAIKVNRIDTILTKPIAESMGSQNDSIYGTDPVGIAAIWVGDGFLNIEYKAFFSGNVKHRVNLVRDLTSSDTPYRLEFKHNAFNDQISGYLSNAIVAFDLSEVDTEGKDVKLLIKVETFNGTKEYERDYNSGSKEHLPT